MSDGKFSDRPPEQKFLNWITEALYESASSDPCLSVRSVASFGFSLLNSLINLSSTSLFDEIQDLS